MSEKCPTRVAAPRAAEAREDKEASDDKFEYWWKVGDYDKMGFATSKGVARSAWHFAIAFYDRPSSRPAIIEDENYEEQARRATYIRQVAYEECARVCEGLVENRPSDPPANYFDGGCRTCAAAIRALAPGGQNAAEERIYTKADMEAACELMLAANRKVDQIRLGKMVDRFLSWPLPGSVCSDACVVQRGYPHRIGTNLLTADEARQMLEHVLAASPAPAEVAKGAGEVPDVCIANDPLRTRFDLPRAAPSLSREEWEMVDKAMEFFENGTAIGPDGWYALRAKVREAGK